MIIRSIRLKNIKSYGEGASGDGITIEFAAGINRIAGRNGHGKSTLIESLGYALFLTPPLFEENVQVATYLLRAGERAAEIDVTFEHEGEVYRVERGLGVRNTRRAKVVELSDGSIAAEGDHEVSAFLCRLLGCPNPERLSELFAKLVGIKQGRLAWPFDSKPTEARKHFEPLLDVEIFRQCFERLKPVTDEFSTHVQEQARLLATVTERVRDRQDAPERLKSRQSEIEELAKSLIFTQTALKKAAETKIYWETIERTWLTLRETHGKARGEAELAAANRKHAEDRLEEAMKAAATVIETETSHQAYASADKALTALQEQQQEKARLEKHRADANAKQVELATKAAAARIFAEDCEKRRGERERRAEELTRQAAEVRKSLAETKIAFEEETKAIHQIRADEESVRQWMRGLPERIARFSETVGTIERAKQTIAGWNSASLETARASEQSLSKRLEELNGQLSAAAEVNVSLKQQLAQISEGLCPFLKERCRQFDPVKVEGDLRGREAGVVELKRQVTDLRQAYDAAKVQVTRLTATEARLIHVRGDLEARINELQQDSGRLVPNAIKICCERLPLPTPATPLEFGAAIADNAAWLTGVRDYAASINALFGQLGDQLQQRYKAFEKTRDGRVAAERDLAALEKELTTARSDAARLSDEVLTKRKEAESLHSGSDSAAHTVAELEKGLKAYASLDEQIAEEQRRKLVHASSHQRYLVAKPIADLLKERQSAAERLKSSATVATKRLEDLKRQLSDAEQTMNPEALENARKAFLERAAEAGVAEERLGNARRELERDEQRLREFEKSSAEKSAIELEISRIEAAIELTEKARGILKNAAPHVAQHLCQRIAARAQQIFNHINHEPSELEWSSERYSLRIHPGDRRFAMLSGGEQTKLALAMTLAMIQEFCGLKFCVFDEPTYGVDSDSRLKLADAILTAQEAAGFDQLLLVSHDDAFDGRIEHTVRLSKASTGTQPVME